MNVTIDLAFLAGLASFLSPCVFSLLPGYVGYLGGRSAADDHSLRWQVLAFGLFFFIGFGLVFVFPRVLVPELGGLLYTFRDWLAKIGGVLIILFGLQLSGIIKLPFLNKDIHPLTGQSQWRGYVSSGLAGAFLSAGWSPCVGPVLGGILTLGMAGESTGKTILLLSIYSAGLALPFMLLAVGLGWIAIYFTRFGRIRHLTTLVSGILLIVIGGMLFMGIFETLARFGYFIDFGL